MPPRRVRPASTPPPRPSRETQEKSSPRPAAIRAWRSSANVAAIGWRADCWAQSRAHSQRARIARSSSSRSRTTARVHLEPKMPRDRTRRLSRLSPVSRTRSLPESIGIPPHCRSRRSPHVPPNSAAVDSLSSRPSPLMRETHAGPRPTETTGHTQTIWTR